MPWPPPPAATTPRAAGISRARRAFLVIRTSGIPVTTIVSAHAVTNIPTTAGSTPRPRPICGRSPEGSISIVTVANAAQANAINLGHGSAAAFGGIPAVDSFVVLSDVFDPSMSVMARR